MNTIQEIKQKLLVYFLNKDEFNPTYDHKHIDIDINHDNSSKEQLSLYKILLIESALKELQKDNFVKLVDTPDERWWVLVQPLISLPQNIKLNLDTCIELVKVINDYCELTNIKEFSDAQNVSEEDIRKIIFIANELISGISKKP